MPQNNSNSVIESNSAQTVDLVLKNSAQTVDLEQPQTNKDQECQPYYDEIPQP